MLTKRQSEKNNTPEKKQKASKNIRKFFNAVKALEHYLYQKKIGEP